MQKIIVIGFKSGIWGRWELFTIPELIEQRAAEKNIIITSIEK